MTKQHVKEGAPLLFQRKFKRCGWGATYCLPKLCDKGPRLHTAPVTLPRMGLLPTHQLGYLPASNQQHGRVSLRLNGSLQLISQGRGKKRKQRPYNQEDSKTSEDTSACMYLQIDMCNCAYTESQDGLIKWGEGRFTKSLKLKSVLRLC